MQTEFLATSRQIETELLETQRKLERRAVSVGLRENAAEALERCISYIAEGGIAWDLSRQKFAVDQEHLPVDTNTLRHTVQAAGPLFLRITKAISRAARVVLYQTHAQIRADA
ncbi:hypothetical protein P775_22615 [Puniceibacterium antarcticum]|uniref:Uncharacterized protein n=1 Tax=Puniceibacterium antarcticum TaxID=1206336 RepID=A0A2G8R8J0_9RHOB|nr:hypothetical protein [Puniceibacterium antarcticum]PIL17870.1 hypothetical protein P775_22615 [Puniceibacterium antarcticum]